MIGGVKPRTVLKILAVLAPICFVVAIGILTYVVREMVRSPEP